MAEEDKEIPETHFLNGQTDDANAKLLNELKVYLRNNIIQDISQQYEDNTDLKTSNHIQQVNEEIIQNKYQSGTESDQIIENHTFVHDIVKENVNSIDKIANNSFQMRLKVLNMELNVIKTYCNKELLANENDTTNKIYNIETSISIANSYLEINSFEEVENELLKAENLCAELVRKIKKVVNKMVNKKVEVIKRDKKDDIGIPDYRSIVTVRGTREDVMTCILKAERAIENRRFDRAQSLLLKAERIFPTKNARDLLKDVWAILEQKPSPEVFEHVAKAGEKILTTNKDTGQTHEIKIHIERQREDVIEREELIMRNSDEPGINKMAEIQKEIIKNPKTTVKEDEPNGYCTSVFKYLTAFGMYFQNFGKAEDNLEIIKTNADQGDSFKINEEQLNKGVKIYSDRNKSGNNVKKNEKLNSYDFPVEAKEFNKTVTLDHIEITQVAIPDGRHNADKNCNGHVTDHSLNEEINEFNKRIKLSIKAKAKENSDKNDYFNPNPSGEMKTSKSVKSDADLKQEKEAEWFASLAVDASTNYKLGVAAYYMEQALVKQPKPQTKKLLQNVQFKIDCGYGRQILTKKDVKFEAIQLLVKIDDLIEIGDLEKAEFFLVVSWDMYRSPHTILYHKKIVKARLALFKSKNENSRNGTDAGISENLLKCDRLVESALDKYDNKKIEEAEELLTRASDLYPCVRINQLLFEIKELKIHKRKI